MGDYFRDPTADEKRAAVRLSRRISSAQNRGIAVTATPSHTPPGRLNTRAAMLATAQQHMGVPVTAHPFTRYEHHHRRSPALRVGIAIDTSPSMADFLDATAGASWICAEAIKSSGRENTADAATFNNVARPFSTGGKRKVHVPAPGELLARGSSSALPDALAQLARRTATAGDDASLVVIVSDADVDNADEVDAAIRKLLRRGTTCAWLTPYDELPTFLPPQVFSGVSTGDDLPLAMHDLVLKCITSAPTPKGWQ